MPMFAICSGELSKYSIVGSFLCCFLFVHPDVHINLHSCFPYRGKAEKLLEQHPFQLSELEEAAINSLKRGRVD